MYFGVELLKWIAQLRKLLVAICSIEKADLALDLKRSTPFALALTLVFQHAISIAKDMP